MTDTVSSRPLGTHLRNLRRKADLSLKTVARALGVSVRQLQDIEASRVHPSEELLIKIGELLGISPFELFDPSLFDQPVTDVLDWLQQQEPDLYAEMAKWIEKAEPGVPTITFGAFLEIFEGLEGRGRKDRLH
jgi:transcriptional regulator with XRE-family HTH domain